MKKLNPQPNNHTNPNNKENNTERKDKNLILKAVECGYYVDDNGNVFSKKNKLNPSVKNDGRKYFKIRVDKQYDVSVSRFVAFNKYGNEIFKKNIVVRHLDNNTLNNKKDNLIIGSQSDNMLDIPINIRIKKSLIAGGKKRVFSNNVVNRIIEDRKLGLSYKKLCEKYNTKKSTLSYFFNKAYYSGARVLAV